MEVTRLLFAMLGGEGGGVVTNWIMAAARAQGVAAQATSVPGVAQRTGATTYYIELAAGADPEAPPVFALLPVAGDIDVVVASELLEAARMVERGYVADDRTLVLASTQRVLTTTEKMVRGDGRYQDAALREAVEEASRESVLFDGAALCAATGAPINAVLLGALAALGCLPLTEVALRGAIEAGGIAVARNLAGFDAGLAAARGTTTDAGAATDEATGPGPTLPAALAARVAGLPGESREFAALGVARLVDYQDEAYAGLYLERLARFTGTPQVLPAVARYLALRMSYEDIARVAQLKAGAERLARVRADVGAAADEPLQIVDYFRPGVAELADQLPASLGRRVRNWAVRRGRLERPGPSLHNRTDTINGYLRVWLLARLRRWRRASLRYAEEDAAIEAWLALVARAAEISPQFAIATAELARVVKGYGETYRRGQATFRGLVDQHVTPVLDGSGSETAPEVALREALGAALAETH